MLIFKSGTQGNMLKNKSALQCFSYWNCYGRSDGHKCYTVNGLN